MAAALEYGYQVELSGGYVFDKLVAGFTSFVSESFEGRQTAKREGDPAIDAVYKMALNSLYGRFAMSSDWLSWSFVKAKKLSVRSKRKEMKHGIVLEADSLDSTSQESFNIIARLLGTPVPSQEKPTPPTSVQVSAAITAYARIAMSRFMAIPGNPLLYSDTDSLFLQYPLSPEIEETYVSHKKDELGKLKYEGRVTGLAVLGPKRYTYLDAEGREHVVPTDVSVSHAQILATLSPQAPPVTYTQAPRLMRDISKGLRVVKPKGSTPLRPPTASQFRSPSNTVVDGLRGINDRFNRYAVNPLLLPTHLKTRRNTRVSGGRSARAPPPVHPIFAVAICGSWLEKPHPPP